MDLNELKCFYFFYCIKDNDLCIYKDVLKVESADKKTARQIAKEIMFKRHPEVPQSFRKTTGKYFYMTDTYSYEYIELDDFDCKLCGEKVEKYSGIKDSAKQQGFCSFEHYQRYKQVKKDIIQQELIAYLDEDYTVNGWISNVTSSTKGYIYLITNKVTGKVYVGQTTQIPLFRWWQHLQSNKAKFERTDLDDLRFEVIEVVNASNYEELKKKLFEREDYYIGYYNSLTPNGYNLTNAKKRENNLKQLLVDLTEDTITNTDGGTI